MKGEIGTLYHDGEQAGGLFDWDNITAQAYWLFGAPVPEYHAKLYSEEGGKLIMRREVDIEIDLPPCTPDKLIRYSVTFSVK